MEAQKPVRGRTKRVLRSAMAQAEVEKKEQRAAARPRKTPTLSELREKNKGYKLIPKEIPNPNRVGLYASIINSFIESGEESVHVKLEGINPQTALQQLHKAVKRYNHPVRVSQRLEIADSKQELRVYLSRKNINEKETE